jgi:hypothetical protein
MSQRIELPSRRLSDETEHLCLGQDAQQVARVRWATLGETGDSKTGGGQARSSIDLGPFLASCDLQAFPRLSLSASEPAILGELEGDCTWSWRALSGHSLRQGLPVTRPSWRAAVVSSFPRTSRPRVLDVPTSEGGAGVHMTADLS